MGEAVLKLKNGFGHPSTVKNEEDWNSSLDEIAASFTAAKKLNDFEFKTKKEADELLKVFDRGFLLLKRHYFNLRD